MDPAWMMFLFGAFGSLALDVVFLGKALGASQMPERYKDWKFWLVRVLLAVVGGIISLAYFLTYNIVSPVLAIQIGATAPAIITSLSQRAPDLIPATQEATASLARPKKGGKATTETGPSK